VCAKTPAEGCARRVCARCAPRPFLALLRRGVRGASARGVRGALFRLCVAPSPSLSSPSSSSSSSLSSVLVLVLALVIVLVLVRVFVLVLSAGPFSALGSEARQKGALSAFLSTRRSGAEPTPAVCLGVRRVCAENNFTLYSSPPPPTGGFWNYFMHSP